MDSALADQDTAVRPVQRQPVQARSRASLERMLGAARTLMIERGNDDFTLNEVGSRGQVSIGSIYHRFENRDELIRAVQAAFLAEFDERLTSLVTGVAAEAASLRALVMTLIPQLADAFLEVAPLLRPIMLRANNDPTVAAAGKRSHQRLIGVVGRAMLRHASEIAHDNPERAAEASFGIIYSAMARHLGFGTADIAAGEGDWTHLKRDLGHMWAAFLLIAPADRPASP